MLDTGIALLLPVLLERSRLVVKPWCVQGWLDKFLFCGGAVVALLRQGKNEIGAG